MWKWVLLIAFFLYFFSGPLWLLVTGQVRLQGNYQTADRSSAHLAPDPSKTPEAIIQVYTARAFAWRGLFAVHTWIAVKPAHASHYQVLEVLGWNKFRNQPVVVIRQDIPDRLWFNARPNIIAEIRGAAAEPLIPKILAAAQQYPYPDSYILWPGPNSNTFIAEIGRDIPQLALALPSNAIGKDFLPGGFWMPAPSHTGYQFSLYGLFGFLIAKKEGLEINVLGAVSGISFHPLAVKWPGIGTL